MADPKTKGMVALVPTAADAQRLTTDGGLPVDEIHLTLLFLGDAAAWDDTSRAALIQALQAFEGAGPVDGDGFALSVFNPGSDDRDTCIVLGIGGQQVDETHTAVTAAAQSDNLPEQHTPWAAHVSLIYTDDLTKLADLIDRTGPITFDRLRVAFADTITDIPLAAPVALAAMPDPVPGTIRPALVTVANVEVLSVGTWAGMTGTFTCTKDDLASAVAAFDDPGYTRPQIKLGHVDPRFDGEPSLGRLINPRLSDDGMTLVVDIAGVPTWLADIMADAYPSRSIEGSYRLTTQTGTTHNFALTALALLGVQAPAVSTLADLAARFGMDPQAVAAAAHQSMEVTPMPDPVRVAASVNLDTVRQAFYGEPGNDLRPQVGGSWSWVREVYNDFIVVDDDEGHLFRVPWSEDPATPGQVVWGDPSAVRVEYVEASLVAASADPPAEGMSRGALRARLAAMTDTPEPVIADPAPGAVAPPLIDVPPVTEPGPSTPELPAAEPEHHTNPEPEEEDPVSTTDLSEFRSRLGLDDTADKDAILAAFDALKAKADAPNEPTPEQVAASAKTEAEKDELRKEVHVLASQVQQVTTELAASKAAKAASVKASVIGDAERLGKFTPDERKQWELDYDEAPAAITRVLASIAPGTAVPVALSGTTGAGEPDTNTDAVTADESAGWASLLNIPAEELTRG